MKKLLLFLVPILLFSCTDYTNDFTTINDRLDKLEQALPSIDEQIEGINTQLSSLKEIDNAIKAQISSLENSDSATATEISNLKSKDSTLEKSISDLQRYVDTQIANAKSEAAAAYATIEQYNNIVLQLTNLQSYADKLGVDLTAKIDTEIKSLTDKITDLENRLKAVEDKVENLLARIQSVSYLPEYADGKVKIEHLGYISEGLLSFRISPKDAVVELSNVWTSALSCEAYYPKTRAVSLIRLTVTEFEGDAENGIITIKVSGEGLSEEFFAGTQEAKIALVISDGNNQVVSDYADAYGNEITDEIWYTTTDGNVLEPNESDFGANIVSNTYENGKGVIKFDGSVTKIGDYAYGADDETGGITTLDTITLPNSITAIGLRAFKWSSLTSVVVPDNVTSIGKGAFSYCKNLTEAVLGKNVSSWNDGVFNTCENLKSVNIPEKVTNIPTSCFDNCKSLEQIEIHDNIISIGKDAFLSCSKLANVKLGNSIESIGAHAFEYCDRWNVDIVLPQSIKKIGNLAFHKCGFTNVTLPDNLEEVGEATFASCTKLNYFYGKYASADNRCFVFNGVLESVSRMVTGEYALPDGITYMDKYCISYPKSVTFVIPESVTDMHNACILGPNNIKGFKGKFASADGLTLVKDGHLYSFAPNGVVEYRIPTGITSVAYRLFLEITTLQKLYIPSTVINIPQKFVDNCSNLKEIYMESYTPPTVSSGSFGIFFDMEVPTIYVPNESIEAYKAAYGWKDYTDKIVGYDLVN